MGREGEEEEGGVEELHFGGLRLGIWWQKYLCLEMLRHGLWRNRSRLESCSKWRRGQIAVEEECRHNWPCRVVSFRCLV